VQQKHTAETGNAVARVKWRGKSSPASWRHDGRVNPTRSKTKKGSWLAARQSPGGGSHERTSNDAPR